MLCVDASVVAEALLGRGRHGEWAEQILQDADLIAPEMLHAEAANIFRRLEARGEVSGTGVNRTFVRLRALPVRTVAFEPCADRIWELRHNLTSYDAWYVATAELHGAPLATLDGRLASAPGPRCEFFTPRS